MIKRLAFWPFPPGKVVYIRKEPQTYKTGEATRFLRTFDGPFLVTGHPYDRNDLLTLKHLSTGAVLPRPVNIEKCVVVPDQDTYDLQPSSDAVLQFETEVQALLLVFLMSTQNCLRLHMSLASICHLYRTKLPPLLRHVNRFTWVIPLQGKSLLAMANFVG